MCGHDPKGANCPRMGRPPTDIAKVKQRPDSIKLAHLSDGPGGGTVPEPKDGTVTLLCPHALLRNGQWPGRVYDCGEEVSSRIVIFGTIAIVQHEMLGQFFKGSDLVPEFDFRRDDGFTGL